MQNIAVVDAGPLIALFDKSDKYHDLVKKKLLEYRSKKNGKLITTWPIVSEASYMLAEHVHMEAELDLFEWIIGGGLDIFDFRKEHLPEVVELQRKYSDVPMDFADATLVIVSQDMGINEVFTVDSDFLIYRLFGKKGFKNLI
ncbi:MAG: PIN domain-containing protein [Candidatus Omnitrophota bacterium]